MSDLPVHPRPGEPDSRRLAASVLRSALLGNIHDAGTTITCCTAGRDQATLFASPALREKILECLDVMRSSALDMPAEDKREMSAIDWLSWECLHTSHVASRNEGRERLWRIVHELVPATLVEVRRYRRLLPGWFEG